MPYGPIPWGNWRDAVRPSNRAIRPLWAGPVPSDRQVGRGIRSARPWEVEVKDSDSRLDVGALLFGGILLFVGGYYFLRNTLGFDLTELDGNAIWPFIVIAIGVAIVMRASRRRTGGDGSNV